MIGSLLPIERENLKFSQLYIYDTENVDWFNLGMNFMQLLVYLLIMGTY